MALSWHYPSTKKYNQKLYHVLAFTKNDVNLVKTI